MKCCSQDIQELLLSQRRHLYARACGAAVVCMFGTRLVAAPWDPNRQVCLCLPFVCLCYRMCRSSRCSWPITPVTQSSFASLVNPSGSFPNRDFCNTKLPRKRTRSQHVNGNPKDTRYAVSTGYDPSMFFTSRISSKAVLTVTWNTG